MFACIKHPQQHIAPDAFLATLLVSRQSFFLSENASDFGVAQRIMRTALFIGSLVAGGARLPSPAVVHHVLLSALPTSLLILFWFSHTDCCSGAHHLRFRHHPQLQQAVRRAAHH